jgi:hypothetical protein
LEFDAAATAPLILETRRLREIIFPSGPTSQIEGMALTSKSFVTLPCLSLLVSSQLESKCPTKSKQ